MYDLLHASLEGCLGFLYLSLCRLHFLPSVFSGLWVRDRRRLQVHDQRWKRAQLLFAPVREKSPGRIGLAQYMPNHGPFPHSLNYGQGLGTKFGITQAEEDTVETGHLHTQSVCQNEKRNASQIRESAGLATVSLPLIFPWSSLCDFSQLRHPGNLYLPRQSQGHCLYF